MTVIIDNYDSFTYNLYHYLAEYDKDIQVFRSDAFDPELLHDFDNIVLSPGPGLPAQAGLMPEVLRRYYHSKRILGICLGHQAICEFFGAKLKNLKKVLHGVAVDTFLEVDKSYIFQGLPAQIKTGRYHSFVADKYSLPPELEVIASDVYGEIQGVSHKTYDVIGLQFHPESVLTPQGKTMIRNWIDHGHRR